MYKKLTPEQKKCVDKIFRSLTLEEKIGQLAERIPGGKYFHRQ